MTSLENFFDLLIQFGTNKFFFTIVDVIFSHKFDETENLWVIQSDKKTWKVNAAAFIDSSLNSCYLSPCNEQ